MPKLYNTLSKKKEAVRPRSGKKLNLFVCGITPYDLSHLGHARTYLAYDVLAKYLRQRGFNVQYVQNVTDIEDKIIQRAKEKGISPTSLARRYEKEYLKDTKALGITSVNVYARATEHIPEIISQVKRLLKKGYAYIIENDGVYYDITRFKDYGKLSRRTSLQAQDAVSRIDDSVRKRSKGDFVLWKFSKKGEPKWESPWGQGRPGWHIEDTAITEKYFGPQYDIHGGARELIFPHHEAEIAQMEAISGEKPMVRYWVHTGLLSVEGKKMAKSLGNFVTIQDFLREHSPRELRLLVLKTHYRSPINYSEKLLLQTKKELERIDEFIEKLQTARSKRDAKSFSLKKFRESFFQSFEDDFNTPKAIATVFNLVAKGNVLLAKGQLSKKDAQSILNFFEEIDEVFGCILSSKEKVSIPAAIIKLAKERERYRREGKWDKADRIRETLSKKGWQVDDTPQGSRLKKA